MSSFNISGAALRQLQDLTKDNPSGRFTKETAKHVWDYIQKYCQLSKSQTYFRFESAGQIYDVDIVANSLIIYRVK